MRLGKRTRLSQMTLPQMLAVFLLGLVLLALLNAPAPRMPSCTEPQFQVGASHEVFFRNIRSYYYRQQPISDHVITYQLKKAESDHLQFLLVQMPKLSEWHIRPFVSDSSLYPLTIEADMMKLNTDTADSEDYWILAKAIYSAVLNQQAVQCFSSGESIPLLLTEEERKRAEQVLFDYFRLLGCN